MSGNRQTRVESSGLHAQLDQLSQTFMPAEREQRLVAIEGSRSLTLLLEIQQNPGFEVLDHAAEKLHHAIGLTIAADQAMRTAHRAFARALPKTPAAETGWGCTDYWCPGWPAATLEASSDQRLADTH